MPGLVPKEHVMQHLPTLEVMKRAVRAEVCPQCSQREPEGEWPHLDKPRPCEAGCTIFLNLPRLRLIVHRQHSASMTPYEEAMRELICQSCQSHHTAGDYCAPRSTRSCPLSRYADLVVDVLERVDSAR